MNNCTDKKTEDKPSVIKEFLRYVLVGGIAFVVDFGVFWVFRDLIFGGKDSTAIIIVSTTAGFIAGIIVNYLLSMKIVFTTDKQQQQGRNLGALITFAVVGWVWLSGSDWVSKLTYFKKRSGESKLLATNFGVKIDELFFNQGKLVVRCFVSGVVLVWNYVGRKIFVFKD